MKFAINQHVNEHEETKKLLKTTLTERDILGTQLIRRNDEIGLLYEKIKILQTGRPQSRISKIITTHCWTPK